MIKRTLDILISLVALTLFSPVLVFFIFLIWFHDRGSPFFIDQRMGKNGIPFRMIKLRSMSVQHGKNQVESTSQNDPRITQVGYIIRRYKIDELSQFWNVLTGSMSVIGPRPNTIREVKKYTVSELELLAVKPGISDISSIVFSDEGEILQDYEDPELAYTQYIRPWKSQLGILYVKNRSTLVDIQLILLTAVAIYRRKLALRYITDLLHRLNANEKLIDVSRRQKPLHEYSKGI